MNTYVYRIFRNGSLADPVAGGTIKAESMKDAAAKACKSNKVDVVKTDFGTWPPTYHYEINGKRVGLVIYANPELLHEDAYYKITREG